MNKTKALILDGTIAILVLLMGYAFYLGDRRIFNTLVYILAIYGFIHFVVDSYGLIASPVPEKTPKPRKYERKVKMDGTPMNASEVIAERFGIAPDQGVELLKEDAQHE